MSERSGRFEYLMEDRELTIRAARFQPAGDDNETRGSREIVRMFAEKAATSHDGLDPAEIFGEEGGVACEAFMARMAERDFPGSTRLENTRDTNSITRDFWRRLIGRPPASAPFQVRGYKVGQVGGVGAMDAYLCEDGKVRAYTTFFEAAVDTFSGERCLVRDIPIDLAGTGKRVPVLPVVEHNGSVVHGLEDVLLGYISE